MLVQIEKKKILLRSFLLNTNSYTACHLTVYYSILHNIVLKRKKKDQSFVFHNMMFWIIFGIRGYRNQDIFYIANRQFEENLLKLVLAD